MWCTHTRKPSKKYSSLPAEIHINFTVGMEGEGANEVSQQMGLIRLIKKQKTNRTVKNPQRVIGKGTAWTTYYNNVNNRPGYHNWGVVKHKIYKGANKRQLKVINRRTGTRDKTNEHQVWLVKATPRRKKGRRDRHDGHGVAINRD